MQKSLFKKYLRITSFTILISFFLLGLVMLAFISQNWQDEKQQLLRKNAESISLLAGSASEQDEDGQYVITVTQAQRLKAFMAAFATNIEADIFVTDTSGNVLVDVYGSTPKDEQTQSGQVGTEIIAQVLAGKTGYSAQGTLGGIYRAPHYVVGVPIVVQEEGSGAKALGAVFTATSSRAFVAYRGDLIKMFFVAALAAFLVSFCIVWLFTYKLVRPLREMAYAAHCFGEGNFAVRVPVTSQDEMGQLALAFNNMASSLAGSESVRRNFIANISHELKTPMTTIAGFIDGILDGTIPAEKQRHYLKIVSQEVKRLSRLVKTMLDLSHIDNGDMKLRPSRFDVTETVLDTLISFERSIEEKEINVRGLEHAQSLFLDGDADMIHQVVYNLVENAVKFTNRGGYIQVTIDDQPERVEITIQNSGAGIAPDEVPLIFDRFYKTDKSRSQDKNGMGLGLYIVRTIVKLHGGEITVSSVQNEYCQFRFWLPKRKEEPVLEERSAKGDSRRRENGKDARS